MVGTRPEAIKMRPVARALEQRGLRPLVVLTGQQSLDLAIHGLEGFEAVTLGCPGREDPHEHVRSVALALGSRLDRRTDLIIVQGDTSSAMGAAQAGFAANVPVAHVEAGLRSHDAELPWPEESYRTAIDANATLLFAPTALAARNLRRERARGDIHVTGNSGIDALMEVVKILGPPAPKTVGRRQILVTCHRRESWGSGLSRIAAALRDIAQRRDAQIELVLHPNRHVADAMRSALASAPTIRLTAPLDYRALIRRIRDADLILTDSGGIQEEAPALGTPVLVLRDKTERPEGIATGNLRLVGTDPAHIIASVERLLDNPTELERMSVPAFPFGDGQAGPRIAEVIDVWLEARSKLSRQNLRRW